MIWLDVAYWACILCGVLAAVFNGVFIYLCSEHERRLRDPDRLEREWKEWDRQNRSRE